MLLIMLWVLIFDTYFRLHLKGRRGSEQSLSISIHGTSLELQECIVDNRRQKPQILLSAKMLGIFGDRSGSPVAGLERSRALTSARALRSHAPRRSCAIRIEGGWLVRCRPRDRSLALTSPGGFRRDAPATVCPNCHDSNVQPVNMAL
jgi:hypothetical protein